MYIKDINLVNFRNYDKLTLNFDKGINIIYGNNGQGKTNLLESIYVLAITKSHRSYIDNHLIKNNKNYLKIMGNVYIENIKNKLEIFIDDKSKNLKIDQNEIKKISDYISKMNIIIFYPDDLQLIKGSPSERRKFLNLELSQLHKDYYILLNDYQKILKMRNDYLKKTTDFDKKYFDIITTYLIDKAIMLYRTRYKFINKLNENITNIFYHLTGIEQFHIKYKNEIIFERYESQYMREKLQEEFKQLFPRELKYKTTLIGPHRDDLEFYIDNKNIKLFGSQGQQRMAVLALKLSEIEIFKKSTGRHPILLLDDVFSELDRKKKNCLLKCIEENQQVLITTTDLSNINRKLLKQAKLIEIDNGSIKKITEVK